MVPLFSFYTQLFKNFIIYRTKTFYVIAFLSLIFKLWRTNFNYKVLLFVFALNYLQ